MSIKRSFTITGTGAKSWVPVDFNNDSINIGILIDKAGGTADIDVEVTHENVLSNGAPTQIVTALQALTAADLINSIKDPVTAVRFNCTAYTSGTIEASILQTGYSS